MKTETLQSILNKCGITGSISFDKTLTSAVTTSWGVGWDEEYIARDLMQNFYDANRSTVEQVIVKEADRDVMVSAPAQFNLARLFYLGSEKGDESVGQYGEGFKAAAVCLLRDQGVTPIAVSGQHVVVLRLSDEQVKGTDLIPVVYDYYTLEEEYRGAALILPGCSKRLIDAMKMGMTHFFYEQNALLGALRWGSDNFSIYDSKTKVGHVFYRNLKRGEIEGIPVVLVINKEYQNIERKVSQDRDRNAFGEEVMGMFYKLFASHGIKYAQSSQAVIVSSARECWAKGHPLLHAISDSFRYREYWSTVTSNEVFGDGYFSKASEIKDPAKAIAVSAMERKWKEEGKIALPGYFKKFSVLNAEREIERLADESSKESQKLNQRMPTALEQQSMKLLMGVLNAMAPEVAAVFSGSRTSYSVIISDKILGELKSGRSYRSRDVFLAQSLFVGDFAAGMATHLHEHAHIFGSDGSRGFTDALTEMFESIVRNRQQFDAIEADWEVLRSAIQEERAHQKPQDDDSAKWIEDLSEHELRSLLSKVPPSTLKRLRPVRV